MWDSFGWVSITSFRENFHANIMQNDYYGRSTSRPQVPPKPNWQFFFFSFFFLFRVMCVRIYHFDKCISRYARPRATNSRMKMNKSPRGVFSLHGNQFETVLLLLQLILQFVIVCLDSSEIVAHTRHYDSLGSIILSDFA